MLLKTERDKTIILHIYYFVREICWETSRFFYFRSMKKTLIFLFLFLLLLGCREKTINLGNDISFEQQLNLSYGNDSQQKLDLYIPKNKDSLKGIFVIVHGGGWKAGNKTDLTVFALSMMQKMPDYAYANINYRLADENSFVLPNQTADIDSAIDFLVKRLESNSKFVILGNSAGAHLSMLYSYSSFYDFKHNNKIKAVINIVGPVDLLHKDFANYSDYNFVEKHMIDLKTSTPNDLKNIAISNPLYWINKTSPPTLSLYGDNDQIIPFSQKNILDSALNINGIKNESIIYPGGHLDWNNEKNKPLIIEKIREFLKRNQ